MTNMAYLLPTTLHNVNSQGDKEEYAPFPGGKQNAIMGLLFAAPLFMMVQTGVTVSLFSGVVHA